MALIKLTRGHYATIDDADEEEVGRYKWAANFKKDGKIYAVRRRRKDEWVEGVKLGETISMHRFILGIHLLNGHSIIGDHRNGDGLDNRRGNLRVCSMQANGQNKRVWRCWKSGNKTSRYKGVVKVKKRGECYQAYIRTGGKKMHIGTFKDELDAAKAYDVMAVKHFGQYANLNFEPGGVPF